MNVTTLQNKLKEALDFICKAIDKKTSIPILGTVLIDADETIRLTASDLEVSCRVEVAAKVKEKGRACIAAVKLREIVSALPDSEIVMQSVERRLKLACERSRFILPGMDANNFPVWPEVEGKPVELAAEDFVSDMKRVLIASSTEESRYMLAGALISGGELVATDGHRLSLVRARWAQPFKGLTIPLKPARLVWNNGQLRISHDSTQILFAGENKELITRKQSGQFPNYQAVYPKETRQKRTLDSGELSALVERAILVSDARHNKIVLEFSGDELGVKSEGSESGTFSEIMQFQGGGEDFRAAFNGRYLADYLAQIEGEVEFYMKDDESAALFRSGAHDCVLMPMRL